MLVVSDTSPVRALHHLRLVALLEVLFADVVVPPAVAAELRAGSASSPVVPIETYPFVRVVAPARPGPSGLIQETELDAGEREAIGLALELSADRLLIDEAEGRRVGSRFGLKVIGVLGVLVAAKRRGLVPAVRPLMDRLRAEINFFIAGDLYLEVLQLAGE